MNSGHIDLLGLTSAITDFVVEVSEQELACLGITKGILNQSVEAKSEFRRRISSNIVYTSPGGSPANVIYGASQLGLQTALIGTVGNDEMGWSYIRFLEDSNIIPLMHVLDGKSAVCYTLITPDGEKSLVTEMGVAGNYVFDYSMLHNVEIFHTSGYELLTNPDRTMEIIEHMHSLDAKISFDLADPDVVEEFIQYIGAFLNHVAVLFMTEEEAYALTKCEPVKALAELSSICQVVCLKQGSRGSVVSAGLNTFNIPAYKTNLVNTLGAGDAYAAGFLAAYQQGHDIEHCGHSASRYAARVCAVKGAHL